MARELASFWEFATLLLALICLLALLRGLPGTSSALELVALHMISVIVLFYNVLFLLNELMCGVLFDATSVRWRRI